MSKQTLSGKIPALHGTRSVTMTLEGGVLTIGLEEVGTVAMPFAKAVSLLISPHDMSPPRRDEEDDGA